MDFSSRGTQRNNEARPAAPAGTPTTQPQAQTYSEGSKSSNQKGTKPSMHKNKVLLVLSVLLSVSILILSIATIIGIATRSSERSYIEKDNYQAVFLNGGQVYFGKISELNARYLTLNDIFYLNVSNSTVQPDSNKASNQDVSLVKLGCELHGPQDAMVINREQVQFWENLNADGKVVTAITDWAKKNPDGQKCETAAAATNTTTPAATTPTTKPTN